MPENKYSVFNYNNFMYFTLSLSSLWLLKNKSSLLKQLTYFITMQLSVFDFEIFVTFVK